MISEFLSKSKFNNIIKDEKLKSELSNLYVQYSAFMGEHMSLFSEYTDHSMNHIKYVIETSEQLIPNGTLETLNEQDVFVLLLSILYHDMGMHIGQDSLRNLINENKTICSIDTDSMQKLWIEYIKEVSRLDNEELESMFDMVNPKALNLTSWEDALEDENLMREFVRRHHHRLAHEIAVSGFPLSNKRVKFQSEHFSFHHNLSGFIARSHGMELRETFEILREEYYEDWKTPRNIMVVYLMCILRVSDYLHITNDRVNPYKLQMFKFRSKRSELETEKHLCTYESHKNYDSPQILYITSEPKTLEVYLEMDYLLKMIQLELDKCWAVLGEVYGKSDIGLSIRRINSNIKSDKWLEKRSYVPEQISFDVDHRVMSLLIDPLYGSNPSFGIRELVQNATDACRELTAKNIKDRYVKILHHKKDDYEYLTIRDNGIGMNLEILKNYFLKIGAPYRKSKFWRDSNENESNKDDVVRNGRFGIGVLSSFLLGDMLTVKTKRYSFEDENQHFIYEFSTELYSNNIQIEKFNPTEEFEPGTEISIILNEITIRALKEKTIIIEEWFKSEDVKLEYVSLINKESINEVDVFVDNNSLLAHDGEAIKDESFNDNQIWTLLEQQEKNFEEVKWSYEYDLEPFKWKVDYKRQGNNEFKTLKPNLVCNGIIIPENYDSKINDMVVERWPIVAIKDLNGKLDLDLSRYKLNSSLPFMSELVKDVYKYFIYRLLNYQAIDNDNMIRNVNFSVDNYRSQRLMFFKNGFSLFNPYFLKTCKIKRVVYIFTSNIKAFNLRNLQDDTAYVIEKITSYRNDFKNVMRTSDSIDNIYLGRTHRYYISNKVYSRHLNMHESNQVKLRESDREKVKWGTQSVSGFDDFKLVHRSCPHGYYNDSPIEMKQILDSTGLGPDNTKMMIVYDNILKAKMTDFEHYEKVFNDYFGNNPILPFNLEERNELFKDSIEVLRDQFKKESQPHKTISDIGESVS